MSSEPTVSREQKRKDRRAARQAERAGKKAERQAERRAPKPASDRIALLKAVNAIRTRSKLDVLRFDNTLAIQGVGIVDHALKAGKVWSYHAVQAHSTGDHVYVATNGYETVEETLDRLMTSTISSNLILSPEYRYVGIVGPIAAEHLHTWILVFGR